MTVHFTVIYYQKLKWSNQICTWMSEDHVRLQSNMVGPEIQTQPLNECVNVLPNYIVTGNSRLFSVKYSVVLICLIFPTRASCEREGRRREAPPGGDV